MATSTVEDYVKRLYLLQQEHAGRQVPMGALADRVGVAPGTATAMVKTLAASGLVDYEPYTGVRLTRNGINLALSTLRRHRLVEAFLVEVLGMDWSEVHEDAEQLEHAISNRVLDRIDAFLDHPRTDPHGDPIPTARGRVDRRTYARLSGSDTRGRLRIVRITDQSPAFLRLVAERGLTPGACIRIESRDGAADTLHLRVPRRGSVVLGSGAAQKILIEPA